MQVKDEGKKKPVASITSNGKRLNAFLPRSETRPGPPASLHLLNIMLEGLAGAKSMKKKLKTS